VLPTLQDGVQNRDHIEVFCLYNILFVFMFYKTVPITPYRKQKRKIKRNETKLFFYFQGTYFSNKNAAINLYLYFIFLYGYRKFTEGITTDLS